MGGRGAGENTQSKEHEPCADVRGWAPTQRVNNACTLPQALIAALQNSGQAAAPGAAATAWQVVKEALAAAAGDALPGGCVLDPKLLYEVLLDAIKLHDEARERDRG